MSTQIKKQQYIVLSIVVFILAVVIGVFAWFGNRQTKLVEVDKPQFKKHTLASPISTTSNESHWIEKTQNAWRMEQEKSKELDTHLKALTDDKEKQKAIISAQKGELSEVKTMLATLKNQVSKLEEERNLQAAYKTLPSQNPLLLRAPDVTSDNFLAIETGFIQYSAKLHKVTKPRIKTVHNYVFSNTFAKARVLQGADVSAGVLSQSNPDVMIAQIVDDGIMPNRHRSPLNGCFVSLSAVGDISSERGKIRTERISCIHPDGTNVDQQVTGVVSDSKNGIRGRVVWRDQPMVKKAFWGSFWESMGKIGQQYATDYSVSPLGSVSTLSPQKIPLAAASGGSTGAAKMYAQYTIKRAEMYHPIIQLPPDTIIDITFLKGFWLDGGTDTTVPNEVALQQNTVNSIDVSTNDAETPEEKSAKQFFYKEHAF